MEEPKLRLEDLRTEDPSACQSTAKSVVEACAKSIDVQQPEPEPHCEIYRAPVLSNDLEAKPLVAPFVAESNEIKEPTTIKESDVSQKLDETQTSSDAVLPVEESTETTMPDTSDACCPALVVLDDSIAQSNSLPSTDGSKPIEVEEIAVVPENAETTPLCAADRQPIANGDVAADDKPSLPTPALVVLDAVEQSDVVPPTEDSQLGEVEQIAADSDNVEATPLTTLPSNDSEIEAGEQATANVEAMANTAEDELTMPHPLLDDAKVQPNSELSMEDAEKTVPENAEATSLAVPPSGGSENATGGQNAAKDEVPNTTTADQLIVPKPILAKEPMAEYRPDPPSENGDDIEDEDTSPHETSKRLNSPDDEPNKRDERDSPDVRPDPPELEKYNESILSTDSALDLSEEKFNVSLSTDIPLDIGDDVSSSPWTGVESLVPADIAAPTETAVEKPIDEVMPKLCDTIVDVFPLEKESLHLANGDDDESYEEIIVDDDDEFIEYYDELLDDDDDSVDEFGASEEGFTEVTYDSQDQKDANFLTHGHNSKLSNVESRPVIKSATQKALGEEAARKKAAVDEAQRSVKFRIARRNSFTKKDGEFLQQLLAEEAEHLRLEEEQEIQRIEEQAKQSRLQADDAAKRIAMQGEEELRQSLELEETKRKESEAESHRQSAEAAAREKDAAEKIRRQCEATERQERETKKKAMEEEVRLLEARLVEAKQAADEAKMKEKEEKKRLQAKVEARRKEKKEQRRSSAVAEASPSAHYSTSKMLIGLVSPSRPQSLPVAAALPSAPFSEDGQSDDTDAVYYSIEQLREQSVPGLDYKNREIYIHPNEYTSVFGISKAEFDQQPKWKKTKLKRQQKLF